MEQVPFTVMSSGFSKDLDLRMDVKFQEKVSESGFNIVEDSSYQFKELSCFLAVSNERFLYEEGRVHNGVSTDYRNFTEEGAILESEEVSLENHPNRLEMAVRPNDILISKITGSKCPAILSEDTHSRYAWSSGFLILRQKNEEISTKFLYYVLRSSFFRRILDRNLSRGIGISAYYPRDLLRLRIPVVPSEVQSAFVREAEKLDSKIRDIRASMPEIPELIDQVFMKELGCRRDRNPPTSAKTGFTTNFSDIGKRKNFRCDVKYSEFYGERMGKVFIRDRADLPLSEALKVVNLTLVRKGTLGENMILIDKEDVLPRSGHISSMEYVGKVDSDKVKFDNSDILFSRIDPFLGHVIKNVKDEQLIGTAEFLGLKVKSGSDVDFMRYSMLSDAFLESTRFLVSGKRQPRISSYDLLSIRMPVPDIKRQREISRKISDRIGDINKKMEIIESLRNEIDDMVKASLIGE